ncbi:hypothetical protein L209DRAFT_535521 [Thermothelomyces heterothallicus CBS 203.75]
MGERTDPAKPLCLSTPRESGPWFLWSVCTIPHTTECIPSLVHLRLVHYVRPGPGLLDNLQPTSSRSQPACTLKTFNYYRGRRCPRFPAAGACQVAPDGRRRCENSSALDWHSSRLFTIYYPATTADWIAGDTKSLFFFFFLFFVFFVPLSYHPGTLSGSF